MFLARVTGTVVASRKAEGLKGVKLLLLRRLDREGRLVGVPLVAADAVRAGEGDRVVCVPSREATLALDDPFVPVDAAVVGIVDDMHREVP